MSGDTPDQRRTIAGWIEGYRAELPHQALGFSARSRSRLNNQRWWLDLRGHYTSPVSDPASTLLLFGMGLTAVAASRKLMRCYWQRDMDGEATMTAQQHTSTHLTRATPITGPSGYVERTTPGVPITDLRRCVPFRGKGGQRHVTARYLRTRPSS
jgi:hypothetical protein